MNDRDDFLDDALGQGLAEANPYDPEALAAHLPARSGEMMLREITSPKQRSSPLERLFGTFAWDRPAPGRTAFVGVLAAVAVAVVGLNVGLSRTSDPDVIDPAESAEPSDVADGSDPLVVDPATTPGSSDPKEVTPGPSDDLDPESDPDTASEETGVEDTSSEETGDEDTAGEDTASNPEVAAGSGCVSIELEDFELTGSWRLGYDSRVSGGAFVTWEGLEPEVNNTSPADLIESQFTIETPGTYRFVFAMRQPFEVGDDSANSSWINVPDAARFGPIGGGSYGGFVTVFGRAKGEFDWSATADVDGIQSEISIVFDTPGSYTMQLAGRSHGHEIDRIVLHSDAIGRGDAIAGQCDGA